MQAIQHIKLSELAGTIAGVITSAFQETYWVIGEVSGHSFYPNKDRHHFDLIEKLEGPNADTIKIKAKSWQEGSKCIEYFEKVTGQKFKNGVQVLIKVKVEYHPVYGLSLTLLDIDDAFTLGNIEKQRRDTLERLVRENDYIEKYGEEYITRNKRLILKPVIQKIALIGSANSEGYTDFIHTLKDNKFKYTIFTDTYYSSVQGGEAEAELVNTLIKIYNTKINYDCIVIIRGGGAKTDFLVFDTYSLSQAIAKFPIPIITGLGHHKDVSISDLMAHTITKTPTKAAEFIISHNHNFEVAIQKAQNTIIIKGQQLIANKLRALTLVNTLLVNGSKRTLTHRKDDLTLHHQIVVNKSNEIINNRKSSLVATSSRISTIPKIIVNNKLNVLANTIGNLRIFTGKYLVNKRGNLNHYIKYISAVSPEQTIKRGFAIIQKNNKIISNGINVEPDDKLKIIFSESEIDTNVISNNHRDGSNI